METFYVCDFRSVFMRFYFGSFFRNDWWIGARQASSRRTPLAGADGYQSIQAPAEVLASCLRRQTNETNGLSHRC